MSNQVVQMRVPASLVAPSDTHLMSALVRGEMDALDLLTARHHTALRRFVRKFVEDEATTEDLV